MSEPGACGDPECHVLHADPANPIHPPWYVDSREAGRVGEPDPVACRVAECPYTAQACDEHRPDPQVGDEVVLRGIVTQRAIDTLGRDIVQVTRGRESYWFARADHAEPAPARTPSS